MNYTIRNENYGYELVAYGDYIAIGSPPSFKRGLEFSLGQVSVKKYNSVINEYEDYITLQKSLDQDDGTIFNLSQDDDLLLENGEYIKYDLEDNSAVTKIENEYGNSLSIYNTDLAVATRFFTCSICPVCSDPSVFITGSNVDIYNLSTVDIIPYFTITSSYKRESGSFGCDVSIGNNIISIGANKSFNNKGEVFLYTKTNNTWSYLTSLTGSNSVTGDYFGSTVKMDSLNSKRLIIANSSSNSSKGTVYLFESSSIGWSEIKRFTGDNDFNYKLQYLDAYPSQSSPQSYDNFGKSLSIYGNNIVIGCPNESQYYEYYGSTLRKRGCVFIYQKCDTSNEWNQIQKLYNGVYDKNEAIFKNNTFGYGVDIFGEYLVASSLKYNFPFSASYITGTLNTVLFDESTKNLNNTLGYVYLFKNISGSWSCIKNLCRKKEEGRPYTVYGHAVSLSTQSLVVGSPCLFLDSTRTITQSISNYRNVRGYAYVYNFNEFSDNVQLGNVFYRTGDVILKTTGSIFNDLSVRNGLYDDPIPYYDVHFDSRITLYENQIICTVEPGEFNVSTNPTSVYKLPFDYDINGDKFFDFSDVDLILRYICKINLGHEQWWTVVIENEYETSLFNYYTGFQNIKYQSIRTDLNNPEIPDVIRSCPADFEIEGRAIPIPFYRDYPINLRDTPGSVDITVSSRFIPNRFVFYRGSPPIHEYYPPSEDIFFDTGYIGGSSNYLTDYKSILNDSNIVIRTPESDPNTVFFDPNVLGIYSKYTICHDAENPIYTLRVYAPYLNTRWSATISCPDSSSPCVPLTPSIPTVSVTTLERWDTRGSINLSPKTLHYFNDSLLTEDYITYFNQRIHLFDFDDSGNLGLNDMFILWKYFSDQLTDNLYKQYTTVKSKRFKYSDLVQFLDVKTSKINPYYIKEEFFNYQYSSSIDNTGSYLAPYITTVGLYNDTNLVAIGKLGTPIKNGGEFPLNILVKWDI